MRVADSCHLSYCTSIHPGETLPEVRSALERYVTQVKQRVCPNAAFGVGLRLSNQAAVALAEPHALAELKQFLAEQDLYVFTINGFPYGAFHGTRVKAAVYEPDWRSPARVQYSNLLADLLAELLPHDVAGSISTVPGGWKLALAGASDTASIGNNLLEHAAHLQRVAETTGKNLSLAIEPEPGCLLETIDECIAFFENTLFSERAVARFARLTGLPKGRAAGALRHHLGLCLDTCHAAVEFEDAEQILGQLMAAAIDVKKLQLSSGLRVPQVNAETLSALRAFSEDVYLHQTVERHAGRLTRYTDLPDALQALSSTANTDGGDREWRVHFHVPIFLEHFLALESTQGFLRAVLAQHRKQAVSPHLEVETYTWNVLPESLRSEDVTVAISRELHFVLDQLSGILPAP